MGGDNSVPLSGDWVKPGADNSPLVRTLKGFNPYRVDVEGVSPTTGFTRGYVHFTPDGVSSYDLLLQQRTNRVFTHSLKRGIEERIYLNEL